MTSILKNKKALFLSVLFLFYLGFWLVVNKFGDRLSDPESATTLLTNTYGALAFFGGVFAIAGARFWGGFRSLVGRSITFFGLGLLAQEFGQLMYAYYIYVQKVEVPYPSLGDIGFLGSVLLYIYAISLLLRACGAKWSLKTLAGKLQLVLIPVILGVSYVTFLKGYQFSEVPLGTVLLDFGYPLLQAIYIGLALLTFMLSRKYLGGVMRPAIFMVLIALVVQYVADFSFLYQVQHETWSPGGTNDLIFIVSYFVMSLSLLRFEMVAKRLKAGTENA